MGALSPVLLSVVVVVSGARSDQYLFSPTIPTTHDQLSVDLSPPASLSYDLGQL